MSEEDRSRRAGPMVQFQLGIMSEQNGNKRKTTVKADPEDVIAAGIVFVAIILALGMVFGSVPINKFTVAILACSGGGGVIAQIVKARHNKSSRTPWIERTILVVMILAFGGYVWASWGWLMAQFK